MIKRKAAEELHLMMGMQSVAVRAKFIMKKDGATIPDIGRIAKELSLNAHS